MLKKGKERKETNDFFQFSRLSVEKLLTTSTLLTDILSYGLLDINLLHCSMVDNIRQLMG